MRPQITEHRAQIIENYLRAKDAQLPHLYRRVFEPDARFIPTYAVPSPFGDESVREGLSAITEAFRGMGSMCENIVTVVPVESLRSSEHELRSTWLVAMTRRDGEGGFVGWGSYRWRFAPEPGFARELAVNFEGTEALVAGEEGPLFDAFLDLPHPWCNQDELADALLRGGATAARDWCSG